MNNDTIQCKESLPNDNKNANKNVTVENSCLAIKHT